MQEFLKSLVPWGTEVLVKVQSLSSEWMVAIFAVLTFLGNEEFYILLLPVVYWCIDRRLGIGLGYVSLLSAWLNSVIKYIFDIPRPADARLVVDYPETSPSFPSGHSQNAVANWGYLAVRFRKPALTVIAIVLIVLIGLSRMVLGVHFPQDVIGGWLIGAVLLLAYVWAEPRVAAWLGGQRRGVQVAAAVVGPLVLIFVHPADTQGLYPAETAVTVASTLLGLGLGVIMERAWLRFSVEGELWRRAVRFAAGLVVVLILYLGPGLLLPEEMDHALDVVLRFVRYAVLGWAVAFLCPWLFLRLKLARREPEVA